MEAYSHRTSSVSRFNVRSRSSKGPIDVDIRKDEWRALSPSAPSAGVRYQTMCAHRPKPPRSTRRACSGADLDTGASPTVGSPRPTKALTAEAALRGRTRPDVDDLCRRAPDARSWRTSPNVRLLGRYPSLRVGLDGGRDVMDKPGMPSLVRLEVCGQRMAVRALLSVRVLLLGLLHGAAPPWEKTAPVPPWHEPDP